MRRDFGCRSLDPASAERRFASYNKRAEAKRRTEREWDARYGAHLFALEHHLAKWQEEKFAELYLAIKERELEIEAGIDMSSDDPGEIEARFVEFDEWCEQREREVTLLVDPELYREMYGQD